MNAHHSPTPNSKKSARATLWKGPQEDGITFSLLCKFLECRERFRLKVVEGLVEDEGFRHQLEFGSMWHVCEEAHSAGKDFMPALKDYHRKLKILYPGAEAEILKWTEICKRTFPRYIKRWSNHPHEKTRKPILEEVAFRVPYTLPSGRTVILRGKWDSVLLATLDAVDFKDKATARLLKQMGLSIGSKAILLQENKTKGERTMDEEGILATVDRNLQTMLYQIALRQYEKLGSNDFANTPAGGGMALAPAIFQYPIIGTLYNVVLRPLSDKYAIRQKVHETLTAFYDRVGESIDANVDKYFIRWLAIIEPTDIDLFRQQCFDPILEQLCDWWEWIKVDPYDPWRARTPNEIAMLTPAYAEIAQKDGVKFRQASKLLGLDTLLNNTIHYQAPWGVYNSLASGWRGSYFNYLTRGSEIGLTRTKTLFPELET